MKRLWSGRNGPWCFGSCIGPPPRAQTRWYWGWVVLGRKSWGNAGTLQIFSDGERAFVFGSRSTQHRKAISWKSQEIDQELHGVQCLSHTSSFLTSQWTCSWLSEQGARNHTFDNGKTNGNRNTRAHDSTTATLTLWKPTVSCEKQMFRVRNKGFVWETECFVWET